MKEKHVRVGVGVFVIKDQQFLVQKRQGSHGEGSWALPGGHLEFNESFEDTVHREIAEETGMNVKNVRFGAVTNDVFTAENKHYITVWMLSDWASGLEQILEPEKCLEQRWCTFEDLPTPRFLPWDNLLRSAFFEKINSELNKNRA